MIIYILNNQSLAALANPHSSLIQAQSRHSQFGFGTPTPVRGPARHGHYPIEMARKNIHLAECP
jgi:hypothetical protein